MKAPKKLYLRRRCKLPYDVVKDEWYEQQPLSLYGCVAYARTDAFIEQACEWLKEQDEMVGVSFEEDFIERFKNYMKGE